MDKAREKIAGEPPEESDVFGERKAEMALREKEAAYLAQDSHHIEVAQHTEEAMGQRARKVRVW